MCQITPPSRFDVQVGGADAEELVGATQLLDAGVEHHEVVDQLQTRLFTHLQQ